MTEYAVLNYLNGRAGANEAAREASVRSATKASRRLLEGKLLVIMKVGINSSASVPHHVN